MINTRTRIDLTYRSSGNWIEVEKEEPGVFSVVDNNMIDEKRIDLGFPEWDAEVEDLDAGYSDASQSLGISSHLKWQDVYLTPKEFRAPSIERLKEALNHVAIRAWCRLDI